jgi:hypothetical protein
MIKINLLPPDKRKAERTPLPRMVLITATAAAAAIVAGYLAWVLLIVIPAKEDEIARERQALASLQPKVAEYERLTARHSQLDNKVKEIKSLITRDMTLGWWRAVDALWTVIHEHPKVWIDDFRVLEDRSVQGEVKRSNPDAKEAAPYGITMRCHVAGNEVSDMSAFRTALKENPILQETLWHINFNTDWKEEEEKDFKETKSLSFSISMWGSSSPPKRRAPGAPKGPPPPGSADAPGGAVK